MTTPSLEWLAAMAAEVLGRPEDATLEAVELEALQSVVDALLDVADGPFTQAGVLLYEVVRRGPLAHSNEALAVLAADAHLAAAGLVLSLDHAAAARKVLGQIAAGTMSCGGVVAWIREQTAASVRNDAGLLERFTDSARRAISLAQQEARTLGHGHVGSEHLLLGVLAEGSGTTASALADLGVGLDAARALVLELASDDTGGPVPDRLPFTPRSKTVLERALREALTLGFDHIGPEHLVLGLIAEGEGLGAQVLRRTIGGDHPLARARHGVVKRLGNPAPVGRPVKLVSEDVALDA